MLSGARGGAGGTSGGRVTGISQASAMLTDGLAFQQGNASIGIAHPYQVPIRAP
jgi:hypothetical protein